MDSSALLPVGTLVLGIVLTFFAGLLKDHLAHKRDDRRAARADESRRAAIGREHATKALAIIRVALDESWKRRAHQAGSDLGRV